MLQANNEEEIKQTFDELDNKVSAIEQLVLFGKPDYPAAINQLMKLSGLCDRRPYANLLQIESVATVGLCTRIASVYVRLFTDFQFSLQLPDFVLLSLQKRFICYVFEISGYGSSEFLQKQLASKAKSINKPLPKNQAALRTIALSPIGDLEAELLVELSLLKTEEAALLTVGLLLDRLPITALGEASRKFLLEEYNPYEALGTRDIYATALANVWMLCSYSLSAYKHNIKKHLNDWFCRMHKSMGIKPKPVGSIKEAGNLENKPVMVVAAESFNSQHAMYRWYAPIIKSLKQDYYMVLVSQKNDCDDAARALFDRYIEVDEEDLKLQSVLDQCTPDLVYFPSVGMRGWAISLANLRWAPLQVMSHGHPATTHSKAMDVVFVNARTFGGADVASENQLILEAEVGSLIEVHKYLELPEPAVLPEDEIHIAVPCNVMKINMGFMAALKEIERLADKPVRFTFFPNEFGLGHLSVVKRIRSFFPNAQVARRMNYAGYLELLNKHHFALSPFPFGNATSGIDCLVLGLPFIALIGPEPHSRSDYDVLSAFGLEDYCVADCVENYVNGAVSWINNPEILTAMRDLVASKNFLDSHTKDGHALTDEFCASLKWAFANKDSLREVHGQVFSPEGNWA